MLTMNEKIVALRNRHKLTQKQMSKLVGVSAPTYIDREHGRTSWRLEELQKMAEIFKVSLTDLLDDTGTMQ